MVNSTKKSKAASEKPSNQNRTEWYYQQKKSQVVGPLTSDQLLAATVDGNVKLDTLVRRGSDETWQPAAEVKGLFEWYYKGWFREVGPLTTAQLLTAAEGGTLKPDTQVRRGSSPWQAASEIKGLFDWYYKGWLGEVGPLLKSRFCQAAREGSIKPDTLIRQKGDSWKLASELQGLFEWYYKRKNKEVGPLLIADLLKAAREGKIHPDTLVHKGDTPWIPASEVEGLFEWYYQNKGKTVGPLLGTTFFKAAIDGTIKPNTLIRRGNAQWQSAAEIEGFFNKVQQAQAAKSAKEFRSFISALKALSKLGKLALDSLEESDHADLTENSLKDNPDADNSDYDLNVDSSTLETDSNFDSSADFGLDTKYEGGDFYFDNDPGFSSDFEFDASSGSDNGFNFDSSTGSDGGSGSNRNECG